MKNINKTFHDNGCLNEEYSLNDKGERDGFYRCFHENGQLRVELKFKDGKQEDGIAISYHDNGNKEREVVVINELYQGELQEWHSNGKLKLKCIYKDDQVVNELYKSTALPKWFFEVGGEPYNVGDKVFSLSSFEFYILNSDELAIYDLILGLDSAICNLNDVSNPKTQERQKTLDLAISWFKENNAEAYKALLER